MRLPSKLPNLYYLTSWKDYNKFENMYKPALAIIYSIKMISVFYYKYSEKLIAISFPINSILSMIKSYTKLEKV